jgi:two-component system response regulator AtoC
VEPRRRLLLVIADAAVRARLSRGLRDHGYSVFGAADEKAAQALLTTEPIDLIIADASADPAQIESLTQSGPTLFAIGSSRENATEQARAAIAAGAYDFLMPPITGADIALALEKAAAREARRGDGAAGRFLPAAPAKKEPEEAATSAGVAPTLICESPRMKALLEKVRKLAAPRTPVLFTGESGTGKEVLARTLHALSPRREGPLVAVNCGALPETLLESLLFGHRRGAFTDAVRDQRGVFEDAHRGTLFLDEVGELPLKLQVKLLRVLQDQKIQPLGAPADESISVDVRLIAATLRNLEEEAAAGRFRADLYYRLSVVPLHVPPLRERVADILPLAHFFLRRAAERFGRPVHAFTPAAQEVLLRHSFPGNVRELENTIERAAVLCEGTVIDAADLPLRRSAPIGTIGSDLIPIADDLSIKSATERLEASYIAQALQRTRQNRSAAARLLGISHRALLYKIRDYGLDAGDPDDRRGQPDLDGEKGEHPPAKTRGN